LIQSPLHGRSNAIRRFLLLAPASTLLCIAPAPVESAHTADPYTTGRDWYRQFLDREVFMTPTATP
jgi:hypothetical protein